MAKILVVEDSPTNMLLTVDVLEHAGHTVLQAVRADQGLAIAAREKLDLILMDIQLPDMDGMAATRILKTDNQTKEVPVIALTASAMKGDRERIMEAGCDGYIEKPIRYKAFLEQIDAIIRSKAT
ncbi:MAG TPA: response regulator [Burkholderiaceae bacterium]|jgi:two-component system cell cycle response regulator DivK